MPRRSALVLRQKQGEEVPELERVEVEATLEYLVDYLFQIGPTMGDQALTFGEMTAWCERSGADLDDFESMAIKQMSVAYLGMLHRARDAACPCPAFETRDFNELDDEEKSAQRAAVAKKLGSWLGSVEESHGKGGMTKRR